MANPTLKRIKVDNTAELVYQLHDQGDRQHPAVVLVHSLAMDHQFWRMVAPSIAKHHSVIAVDVRGHGQSSKSSSSYSIDLFARDIKQVVDQEGFSQVVIAGASMGGCIALQYASNFPESTVGLGLIDTTAWYGPTALKDWKDRGEKARENGLESLVHFQKSRWFSEKFREENAAVVDECIQIFLKNDIQSYVNTCHAMGSFDGRAGMNKVKCKTEIVVGEEDYAAPIEMSQALKAGITSSSLTVIQSARHLTPIECPAVIIDAINRLVKFY